MSDILIWQPRYGYCQWFRSADGQDGLRAWDKFGYFYAPLILFDQAYVHRTIYYIRPDGSMLDSFPPYEEYHPTRVNRFHGRFPYVEK